jgi:hypothetical protein
MDLSLRFISNCKWLLHGGSITMIIPRKHTNILITYTIHIAHAQIHISPKITPLNTNKQTTKQKIKQINPERKKSANG